MSDVSPSKGANIIAADYNANMAMGNLARQAESIILHKELKLKSLIEALICLILKAL